MEGEAVTLNEGRGGVRGSCHLLWGEGAGGDINEGMKAATY